MNYPDVGTKKWFINKILNIYNSIKIYFIDDNQIITPFFKYFRTESTYVIVLFNLFHEQPSIIKLIICLIYISFVYLRGLPNLVGLYILFIIQVKILV